MKKVRSNALWTQLTPEQRNCLDKWLFEEEQSYEQVWQKAQAQFKYKGSKSSITRYHNRRRKEQIIEEFKDLRDEVAAVNGAPADPAAAHAASMKLLETFLFQQLRKSPDKVKEWAAVASLIVQNDYNETMREEHKLRREMKTEDQKLKREAMAFAKEKFQFDTIEMAMKLLPELRELEQARKDPDLKRYESNAMLNRMRRRVFGVVWEVRPESAKEEEEMLAARRERVAQKKREEEERKNRERITQPETPTPSSPYYQEYLEWKARKEQGNEQGPFKPQGPNAQ